MGKAPSVAGLGNFVQRGSLSEGLGGGPCVALSQLAQNVGREEEISYCGPITTFWQLSSIFAYFISDKVSLFVAQIAFLPPPPQG